LTLRGPMLRTQAMALAWAIGLACLGIAQAQGMATPVAATREIRRQLETLLPALRIDDGDLQRALEPKPWTACRSLGVEWKGPTAAPESEAEDGRLTFVGESRCREPYDVRASARLGADGLVAVATDRHGALIWWRRMPDIRRVQPMLLPRTGDEAADRESKRLHSEGVRVGFSRFGVEIPGDRRIARLSIYEASRAESARLPRVLGGIEVPMP